MASKLARLITSNYIVQLRKLSSTENVLKVINKPKPLITSRRTQFDFYKGTPFKKLDDIPLASKGWQSNKSKGDYFILHEDNLYEDWKSPAEDLTFPNFLHDSIHKSLQEMSITNPSWIQNQSIDMVLSGAHSILAAETGCGKTLAYLIPIVQQLLQWEKPTEANTPHCVVIVPNRELAEQVSFVAKQLLKYTDLKSKVIIGGHTKRIMMNPTFEHIDILISTPGCLGKLATTRIYHLNKVRHAVLDEADTLLDDSFQERLTMLVRRFPLAQMTLVSATIPKELPPFLEHIENDLKYLRSPMLHRTLANVKHRFLRLLRSAKPSQLLQIAKAENNAPMLIFTNKSNTCNWVSLFLNDNGIKACNFHGDMATDLRRTQWEKFLRGAPILVTTDIASRGLDTSHIKHVVNYDFPLHAVDYIHRCGRTGRLGSPEFCRITNFVSGSFEVRLVQQIELAVRKGEPIPNVDGNIAAIIRKRELRRLNDM